MQKDPGSKREKNSSFQKENQKAVQSSINIDISSGSIQISSLS